MDPLLEGVIAAAQPCSLALVVPAAGATVLGGRNGWLAAIACWTTATLAAWGRATGLVQLDDGLVVGIGLALVALTGTAVLWRRSAITQTAARPMDAGPASPRQRSDAAQALTGGGLVGLAAGVLWRPCVGPALGTILSAAPADRAGQLGPFAAYMAGLLAVTAAVATLTHLHPAVDAAMTAVPTRGLAATPLLLLVVVLATGSYGTVVGALVRASSLG